MEVRNSYIFPFAALSDEGPLGILVMLLWKPGRLGCVGADAEQFYSVWRWNSLLPYNLPKPQILVLYHSLLLEQTLARFVDFFC